MKIIFQTPALRELIIIINWYKNRFKNEKEIWEIYEVCTTDTNIATTMKTRQGSQKRTKSKIEYDSEQNENTISSWHHDKK